MIIAMFLAHLVGDFVLQWDALACWKAREFRGVVVHSLILLAVTAAFALPFDPTWWIGILIIGVTHFAVDTFWFITKPTISPLLRFIIDQFLHFFFIIVALVVGGYLQWGELWSGIVAGAREYPQLTAVLGYAFITMPAWVLLKFVVYALVRGQAPNFPAGPNKFVGIAERLIITTLVLFGQALFVPLIALPRLIIEWPRVSKGDGDEIYVIELIASFVLAVGVGLSLTIFI